MIFLYRHIFSITLTFLSVFSLGNSREPIIELDDRIDNMMLQAYEIQVYEDTSNSLNIHEIEKKKFTVPTQDLPVSKNHKSTYWVKLLIKGNPNTKKSWIIESYEVYTSEFTLYRKDKNGKYYAKTTGTNHPFHHREFKHFNLAFNFNANYEGIQPIYYKIKSNIDSGLLVNIRSTEYYSKYAFNEYYILGLYYGILIFIMIYNFMVYLSTKEKIYIYYVIFVAGSVLNAMIIDGTGFQYFWPNHPEYTHFILKLSPLLLLVFFVLYGVKFLKIDEDDTKWLRLIKWNVIGYLIVYVFSIFRPNIVENYLYFVPFTLVYIGGWRAVQRNYYPAKYFVTGFSLFLICVVINVLRGHGLEKFAVHSQLLSIIVVYAFNIGNVIELLVFSYGLAQRIQYLKTQKESADQEVIYQLKENESLKDKVNKELEQKVLERTSIIEEKNKIITEKNNELTSSIIYAKRIQDAAFPNISDIKKRFSDICIYYKPRDIVSGDFYWFDTLENRTILVVGDCTGHGVPGAFMSLIGIDLLNLIINKNNIYQPDIILEQLHKHIRAGLKQDTSDNRDGMEVGIIMLDHSDNTISFAGANTSLIMSGNENNIIKGDIYPIGGYQKEYKKRTYTRHILPYNKGIRYFISTDGYYDQLGGSKGGRFMFKNLVDLIHKNNHLPLESVVQKLDEAHITWKNGQAQIDDILIIGIEL